MHTRCFGFMAVLLASAAVATAQVQMPASPSSEFLNPSNSRMFGQVDFGGRFTTVDGDPARYQRYRDLRDGVFFDLTGFHREGDAWVIDASVHNAGYRDQQYDLNLANPGKVKFRFLFDQTPTYISGDTRTPYSPRPAENGIYDGFGGTLDLPDEVQRAIQEGELDIRLAMETLAVPFKTRIRRDSLGFNLVYAINENFDAKVQYLNTRKQGAIPYGASFGFNLAVEVPLPIDSKANDFSAGVEWANDRGMFRFGWDGSWYTNDVPVLVWDNPKRIDDRTYGSAYSPGDGTSRGRLAEWPTNTFQQFSATGAYRFAKQTSLNGTFAYGLWDQDEALVPHTINSAIEPIPLARTSAQGEAKTKSVTLNFISRAIPVIDLGARLRYHSFANNSAPFSLLRADGGHDEYVRLDQVPEPFTDPELHKLGPEHWGYDRTTFDVDAGFNAVKYTTFKVGYGHFDQTSHYRVYEKVKDNTFRASADVVGSQYVSFRSQYEYTQRRGSGIEDINGNGYPDSLEIAGEQPGMRHYDIASKNRNRLTLLANMTPSEVVGLTASVAWAKDDFLNDETAAVDRMGLQDYKTTAFAFGVDASPRPEVTFGASYAYDKYQSTQASRTASPGAQFEDPRRNWGTNEDQHANSFLVYLDLMRAMPNTDIRFSYSLSRYTGSYIYTLVSNSTLNTPEQLPDITSDEDRATVDFRYFFTRNWAAGFVYYFDKYRVDDWAFSPDIFTGVAQPPVEPGQTGNINGILLNYYYRPYTSHTGWLRLTYVW